MSHKRPDPHAEIYQGLPVPVDLLDRPGQQIHFPSFQIIFLPLQILNEEFMDRFLFSEEQAQGFVVVIRGVHLSTLLSCKSDDVISAGTRDGEGLPWLARLNCL